MSFEFVLFLGVASLAILFGVGMLLSKNAVHSALFLIGNFGCVAIMYLMLNAPFIGMVQIAVYAGAIMVLFLFVIMLLGAEETTDTTRTFRWLTGAAVVLGISFLAAIGTPLVIQATSAQGFALPAPQPNAPTFRLVHTAGVPDNKPVNISISGGTLTAPLILNGVAYGAVTDFQQIGAGNYNVLLTQEDGSPVAPPANITLNNGDVASVVVYGELNIDNGTFPQVITIPQSFAPQNTDNATRLVVFNGWSQEPVTLVDLGVNKVLDIRKRPQLDADGQAVVDANGNAVLVDGLADTVVAQDVTFGAIPSAASISAGAHHLAFINTDFEIVKDLGDLMLAKDSEQLVLLVADYEEFLGADSTYRARVFRDDSLTITTPAQVGSPASIGQVLFTDYLLPVNIVGILLLVALVGVIVLTRPDGEKQDRRVVRRRKVSRPLVSVISSQTGGEVTEDTPKLPSPQSGD
jgi:NADH-quinone oxidoreductase subunit J